MRQKLNNKGVIRDMGGGETDTHTEKQREGSKSLRVHPSRADSPLRLQAAACLKINQTIRPTDAE